jgi:two-component system cell cycle sensor histidine kinase/response regulator CckA
MNAQPTRTVLLIEDNAGDARLIREMFNEQNPQATELKRVECIAEAERHLAEQDVVAIILLDLGLPDAQGVEAVRRIHAAAPRVPLVVLTGMDDETLATQTLQEGAQDYLIKGEISTRSLLRAMRYAIERKIAEQALLQNEEQYRVLFEGNPNPMWVFDSDTLAILAINEASVLQYGYSAAEFLKMNMYDVRPPDEVAAFRTSLAAISSRTTGMGSAGVFKHRKKSGQVIEVEVAGSPIQFQGHRARLILINDITEKNNLQAELLQARKLESLGRLAGGVAHDLNNLMGVVLGYAELTLDYLDHLNPLRHKVEGMQKAAERAVSIVRQLLAFSRNQIQRPQMLNLNAILEDMEEMLQRLIGEDIGLVIVTNPALGTVKADPGQIEQIIMNLVVNARDAMPQGGKLTISAENVELEEVDLRRESDSPTGSHVMLSVCDTGCGMDAATQAKIFEPFFTTKGPGKGTGLGLATVYGIVKQSSGSVSVRSIAGQGATFQVCLPRVEATAQPPREVRPVGEIPKGWETVLLVEDAEPLREVVLRFLRQGGYNVLVAQDGVSALAACREHNGPIHLLLTDVVMPGLSGPQLAKEVCNTRPGLPVLYMSGYTDEALGPHGVLEEGIALLEKPFTRGSLLRKVREILDPRGPARRDIQMQVA